MAADTVNRRIVLASVPAAAMVLTHTAQADTNALLDGAWEGDLAPISGAGIAQPVGNFGTLNLLIRGDSVQISVVRNGERMNMSAYPFQIQREGTNAVVDAILSDPSAARGSSWVETWNFTITLADADTLNVAYVRMVNNNGMRPDEDGARFTQIRVGQMHRGTSDHV